MLGVKQPSPTQPLHFPSFSTEHWGSSRQHPMWSLSILISTRWRISGHSESPKGMAECYFHILRRDRHALRKKKMRTDKKRWEKLGGGFANSLRKYCVNSCKFWSASCSEALAAQHACTDSTQRWHFHYAWKRGMTCIMLGCSLALSLKLPLGD